MIKVRPSPYKSKMIIKFVYTILSLLVLLSIFIFLPNFEWRQLGRKFLSEHSGKPSEETDESYDPEYYDWQIEQDKRKELIKKTCAHHGSDLQANIDKSYITFDKKDGILNCRINKVASATILNHFYPLTPFYNATMENLSNLVRIKAVKKAFSLTGSQVDLRKLVLETVSFTFVRHPFERLVSAFQFLLVDKSTFKLKDLPNDPTFPDFINWILKDFQKNCRSHLTCNMNGHWIPYTAVCGHCDLPYSVIGKLETMAADLYYIGRIAGVPFGVVSDRHMHRSSGGETSNLTRQYFQQVDKEVIGRLYNAYWADFKMFGYEMDM